MAKVVITLCDNEDLETVNIQLDFEPKLEKGLEQTQAQNIAGALLMTIKDLMASDPQE